MLDLISTLNALSTLNCVYFLLLLIGVLWTAVVLVGGVIASVDLPHMDIDIPHVDVPDVDFHLDHAPSFDHGSVGVSPLSPITIASFITSFGGIGLIGTQLLQVPDPISVIYAGIGATIIATGMFWFYSKVLIAGEGSSEVRLAEIGGKKAEVIIPIPADGLGQITIVARGRRTTWGARSADGQPIPRGAVVHVQSMIGNTAIVERQ